MSSTCQRWGLHQEQGSPVDPGASHLSSCLFLCICWSSLRFLLFVPKLRSYKQGTPWDLRAFLPLLVPRKNAKTHQGTLRLILKVSCLLLPCSCGFSHWAKHPLPHTWILLPRGMNLSAQKGNWNNTPLPCRSCVTEQLSSEFSVLRH